jgi:predicted ferric reductase
MNEITSAQATGDGALAIGSSAALRERARTRRRWKRGVGLALVWAFVLGNTVAIFYLWIHGGRLSGDLSTASTKQIVLSLSRITGLLGAYLALIEVALLARLPWLERLAGFDKLANWHRWNGHACLWLILAHTFLSIWGYQLWDNELTIGNTPKTSYWDETARIIWGDVYPGMIVATVGTGLLVLVAFTSYVFVRRRVSYELWYAIHITAYAGIALGWFHQIPTGNDLIHIAPAEWYWRSLYIATLVLVAWRVAVPFINGFRHRLRIAKVVPEGPGVVSLHIAGRKLDKIRAAPGQFFIWRFLAKGFWWAPLPFSLSAAPDGRSFRITAKALGNHSARMDRIVPGTRVVAEGPFGVFTDAWRTREKVLLVAGGIGITPIRALIEEMEGDVVVLYRVVAAEDLVFGAELERLATDRGMTVHNVVGDHATPEGRELLSPAHLKELVPDVADREVYLCGPIAMIEVLQGELRRAGVPRRHLHVERFAL